MIDKLDRYFTGELYQDEKDELLKAVISDDELCEEFVLNQELMAFSALLDREGDDEIARAGLERFKKRNKTKSIKRYSLVYAKYAAAVAVVFMAAWFGVQKIIFDPLNQTYTEIEVPQGGRVHVRLDDGTNVWLNSRSKLKYPNVFSKDNRTVMLEGEGFFEVQRNEKKPFIVKTSRYDVQVLGTKFNVYNYSEIPVFETTLLEGSVKVFKADNEENAVFLKPNERIVMKNGSLEGVSLDKQNLSLWEKAYFIFDNEPFENILRKLEVFYEVRFVIRNEMAMRYPYTGNFNSMDSLEDILEAIKNVQKFKYSMSPDRKIIYID